MWSYLKQICYTIFIKAMALETPKFNTPGNSLPPDIANMSQEQRDALMHQLESLKTPVDQQEANPEDETISPDLQVASPDFGADEPAESAPGSTETPELSPEARNLGDLVSGDSARTSALLAKVQNLESTPADFEAEVEQGRAGELVDEIFNNPKK